MSFAIRSNFTCPILYTVLLFSIGLSTPVLAQTRVVDIADGDYGSLQNALCDAALQEEGRTVIHLAERGYYRITRRVGVFAPRWRACWYGGRSGSVPAAPGAGAILSHVVIRGNNATLDFEGEQGLVVNDGGRLELEAVELRNSRQALVVNGRAELARVSVVENTPEFPEQRAPVHNRGRLELRNSVVAANRLQAVPAELLVTHADLGQCPDTATAGLLNEGTLVANNVTFYDNDWAFTELPEPPTGACVTRDLVNLPGAEAWFGNSLVSSSLFATCVGTVHSRGYNAVPEGDACGFTGPGDIVGFAENVYAYVPHDAARQVGRDMFVPDPERLTAGSPEPLGSSDSACERLDVRGYVRGERTGTCLRGAFDLGAAPALDSGLDGLWGDPDNDGQYLQVSHYGRNRILLTWYGFDPWGEQLWVYASAVFEGGNRASAQAWRNTGVRLVDGRLEGEVEALPFGELTVEILSCDELRLSLDTDDPDIGHLDYLLTRLTDNAVAACSD